jgi:hypothetical protein
VGLFFGLINTHMTALTRNPSNTNFLQSNKFSLNFSRLPNVQFFCQSVGIPGLSMSEAPQNTPFVDLYLPGDKAIYDLLNVTFIVDEDLTSWKEVHDWIRAMTFPTDFEEYRNLDRLSKLTSSSQTNKPQFSDASITLLSSANKPNYRFKFYDVFPITLSTFILSANDSPENLITADATFRYSWYDIEKVA